MLALGFAESIRIGAGVLCYIKMLMRPSQIHPHARLSTTLLCVQDAGHPTQEIQPQEPAATLEKRIEQRDPDGASAAADHILARATTH